MFKLSDGRQNLYQWDVNVKLDIIDVDICEVHFTSKFSDEVYTVEVIRTDSETFVYIPNILLQRNYSIVAYAFLRDEDQCLTKTDITFEVIARPKPADYVYTEIEIKSYEDLKEEIEKLKNQTGGNTGGGGVSGGITDVKINDTSIVSGGVANIPVANRNNLGVVKVSEGNGIKLNNDNTLVIVNAQNSRIDARNSNYNPIVPNNLDYAVKRAMCDGKGAEWTNQEKANARNRMGFDLEPKVIEIEITEEVRKIEVTSYNDKPLSDYDFKQLWIIAESAGGLTATNNEVQIRINDATTAGDTVYLSMPTNFTHNASKLYWGGIMDIRNGLAFSGSVGMAMAKWRSNAQATINMSDFLFEENINSIYCYAVMTNFPVGTKFKFILR